MAEVRYKALPDTPGSGTLSDYANAEQFVGDTSLDKHIADRPRMSKWLLLAFCGIRCSDPIVLFVIYPYVNEMLIDYGLSTDARSTGYKAGILEAAFAFANGIGIIYWVKIADTRGRRIAMIPTAIATAPVGTLFGFVKSFPILVAIRLLCGLLNGQAAIAKTYLAEVSDSDSQAFAFSLMSLGWQLGWCFSATVGGYFAHPERHFSWLAGSQSLQAYPYVLPPLIVAVPPILAAALGYYTLTETKPPSKKGGQGGAVRGNPVITMWCSTYSWTTNMWRVFHIWSTMVFINIFFQSTLPLFLFAPVQAGGMGMPTSAIGTWYAIRAGIILLIEVPVYPRLHKRFGSGVILRGQMSLYLVIYGLFPLCSLARRHSGQDSLNRASLAILAIILVGEALAQTMFISGDLLCTNAAPSKDEQSMFNAVIEFTAKMGQLSAAWFGSWLFAYSAQTQFLNGYLVWAAIWLFSLYGCRTVYRFEAASGWRSAYTPLLPITPRSATETPRAADAFAS